MSGSFQKKIVIFFLLFCMLGLGTVPACAAFEETPDVTFRGQLSTWTRGFQQNHRWDQQAGVRYLPGARVEKAVNEASFWDAEVIANAVAAAGSGSGDEVGRVEIYRATLRYATPKTDTSLGLQKIAFGPTRLLRPLGWFDRIDPADPVGFTEGVYSLRFRYDALNNANAWLWCMMFNDDPKGNESVGSAGDRPEWGGRIQAPVLDGELAATFHFRTVDGSPMGISDFSQRRYALDGRWDPGVGLWFEAVLEDRTDSSRGFGWVKTVAIGTDYTFDWGNGLYALVEHMAAAVSGDAAGWDEDQWVTAWMLDYPVNIVDTVTLFGSYQWENGRFGSRLNWQRTFDEVIVNVGIFDYPGTAASPGDLSRRAVSSGSGVEIVLIYNH